MGHQESIRLKAQRRGSQTNKQTNKHTKMTGLMSTFQKKIVLGHDVTDDVINVIYDVISASKLENAITLLFFNRFRQSIHQNHGIEMKFQKNLKKNMQQP